MKLAHNHTREGVNCALQWLEPFSCPEFGLPLASGASRCSVPQPGTVYLLRYEPPNCRWAPSSACWRLSFSSMREPSSSAVVTEQRARCCIQISGLNSTQPHVSSDNSWCPSPTTSVCHLVSPANKVFWHVQLNILQVFKLTVTSLLHCYCDASDTMPASLWYGRLRFFGHIARAQSTEDHRRAVWAAMQKPSLSWKRHPGRPSLTWLRVIADDVKPMNFGVHTAWRKANDRMASRRGHSNTPVGVGYEERDVRSSANLFANFAGI